jgi:hypothetical protein
MSKPSTAKRRLQRLKVMRNDLGHIVRRGGADNFDIAEYAALCWAVKVIEANWETAQHISGEWRTHLQNGRKQSS